MEAAVANKRFSEIRLEQHAIFRRQMQEWFAWMDHILDVHRSNFVFRQPNSVQLGEHKRLLEASIRTCLLFNALIADPDFTERDLADRLNVRIQQLRDAYETFHDTTFSDEQANEFLKSAYPE